MINTGLPTLSLAEGCSLKLTSGFHIDSPSSLLKMWFFAKKMNFQALVALILSFVFITIGKAAAVAPPYGPSQFSNIGNINEYNI